MRADPLHVLVLTRVIAPLHGVGGLERHGRDLVEHLLVRGVRVTLVTQPPTASSAMASWQHERLTMRSVTYRTFPMAGRRGTTVIDRSTAYPWFGWRAGRLAAELVRAGGIDLVHGMGAAALGYAAAREADRYETVPFIVNPHGMEEFGSTGPRLATAKHLLYAPLRAAVRRCARAADRVIATDAVLVPTVREHLHVDDARVTVVPNAVDLDAVASAASPDQARALRARAAVGPDAVLMVAVGRLEANKGFQVLLEALGRLGPATPARRPWTLVLLGEGSERNRLERLVDASALRTRVLMPGRVSDAELHAWYEAADLFVHPSLYEGSSIVTLEAMAHGLPVVATRAGGLPDKVRPGLNGWLVEPGDGAGLAASLEVALDRQAPLRQMGLESRGIVEREFGWFAVIDRLLAVYDEMLRGRVG
jgi:glycosyltransferase involved in cell wall biosynthesis